MNGPSGGRRSFLKLAGVAAVTTTAAGAVALTMSGDRPSDGPNASETVNRSPASTVSATSTASDTTHRPTESVTRTPRPLTAASAGDLHAALARASNGETVYVTTDIAAGTESFVLPEGVTLSGTGRDNGLNGPTLSTEAEHYGMVKAGANSRITGLRFDGPIYRYVEGTDPYPAGSAIETHGRGVEVDHCEIFGFSWAGVDLSYDAHVHHNKIHHCSRSGLGYGVLVGNGAHPLIEWNYFNYNRHSVAGNDRKHKGTGYEVRYNRFGKDVIQHVVDMHPPGGKSFEVHHNTFVGTEVLDGSRKMFAILVRGVPSDVYDIHNNWFYLSEGPPKAALYDDGQAIAQVHQGPDGQTIKKFVHVTFSDNHYGPDEPTPDIGVPRGEVVGVRGGSGGSRENGS